MNTDLAGRTDHAPAARALLLRDQALAALDDGDAVRALAIANEGLAVLATAGLDGGPDAAAVLVARAEIEECLDCFSDVAVTTAEAIAILEIPAADGDTD